MSLVPPSRSVRLHPYLELIRRYWAVVLAATLLGALVGYGLSQLATPSYSAKSTLYFSIGFGSSGSDLNQGASYAQSQMLSFAELARSERVLNPVIADLDLDLSAQQLASQVEATTPASTVVLNIAASSADPELAASIANSVAQSLTDAVADVAPRDADGRATVTVRTVQSADPPTSPVSPNSRVNVVAAAVIGLVLSLLVIAAIRLLDTRLCRSGGVEAAGGLPVLGRVHEGSVWAAESAGAEDYRRLVATLDAIEVERPARTTSAAKRARVFVLASVERAADTDAVAATLAHAAREAGQRVTLVTNGEAVAADGESIDVTVRALPEDGKVPSTVASTSDLVLIAAPGAADGSRALRLGQEADGVLLLADEGRVHVGELRAAIEQLRTAGARVAGTVLTASAAQSRAAAVLRHPLRSRLRRPLPVVLEHHEA